MQDKDSHCLELYSQGFNDYEIARAIGVVRSAVWQWRTSCRLPPNSKRGRSRHNSGVPMRVALPTKGCRLVRQFLWYLVVFAEQAEWKADVGRFMRAWRRIAMSCSEGVQE